jgi:hypothetical protein
MENSRENLKDLSLSPLYMAEDNPERCRFGFQNDVSK